MKNYIMNYEVPVRFAVPGTFRAVSLYLWWASKGSF
jgi:hypothetical protein